MLTSPVKVQTSDSNLLAIEVADDVVDEVEPVDNVG